MVAAARREKMSARLYGALRIDAGLPEAHVALCLRHQARHRLAEVDRDREALARAEVLLRQHVAHADEPFLPQLQRAPAGTEGSHGSFRRERRVPSR